MTQSVPMSPLLEQRLRRLREDILRLDAVTAGDARERELSYALLVRYFLQNEGDMALVDVRTHRMNEWLAENMADKMRPRTLADILNEAEATPEMMVVLATHYAMVFDVPYADLVDERNHTSYAILRQCAEKHGLPWPEWLEVDGSIRVNAFLFDAVERQYDAIRHLDIITKGRPDQPEGLTAENVHMLLASNARHRGLSANGAALWDQPPGSVAPQDGQQQPSMANYRANMQAIVDAYPAFLAHAALTREFGLYPLVRALEEMARQGMFMHEVESAVDATDQQRGEHLQRLQQAAVKVLDGLEQFYLRYPRAETVEMVEAVCLDVERMLQLVQGRMPELSPAAQRRSDAPERAFEKAYATVHLQQAWTQVREMLRAAEWYYADGALRSGSVMIPLEKLLRERVYDDEERIELAGKVGERLEELYPLKLRFSLARAVEILANEREVMGRHLRDDEWQKTQVEGAERQALLDYGERAMAMAATVPGLFRTIEGLLNASQREVLYAHFGSVYEQAGAGISDALIEQRDLNNLYRHLTGSGMLRASTHVFLERGVYEAARSGGYGDHAVAIQVILQALFDRLRDVPTPEQTQTGLRQTGSLVQEALREATRIAGDRSIA